ncbi:MAG: MBL fold metallo-hydrolase [Proteobacteria bacterium]|nr:MBL fold metallo-hydrolase [Pseudomonadota bacterium]MBU1639072.1 MBL fold metallo-hydrolase [Pseudomonadota bacterium]
MKFCVLGSGSKGNATYVEANGRALLIDAGFSGKEICRRLEVVGVSMATVEGVLLTHEHNDHIQGAGILARKYKTALWANQATFKAASPRLGQVESFKSFQTGEKFSLAGFTIHPFAISHDTADPVGFVVEHDGVTLGFCTDTGMVSRLLQQRLTGCHGLILECNHDLQMLADGPYPLHLQQRVRSRQGHLANNDAARFLGDLLHDRLQHVVLAHLSETNNLPDLALEAVTGFLATVKNGFPLPEVSLSWQERPGVMVELCR